MQLDGQALGGGPDLVEVGPVLRRAAADQVVCPALRTAGLDQPAEGVDHLELLLRVAGPAAKKRPDRQDDRAACSPGLVQRDRRVEHVAVGRPSSRCDPALGERGVGHDARRRCRGSRVGCGRPASSGRREAPRRPPTRAAWSAGDRDAEPAGRPVPTPSSPGTRRVTDAHLDRHAGRSAGRHVDANGTCHAGAARRPSSRRGRPARRADHVAVDSTVDLGRRRPAGGRNRPSSTTTGTATPSGSGRSRQRGRRPRSSGSRAGGARSRQVEARRPTRWPASAAHERPEGAGDAALRRASGAPATGGGEVHDVDAVAGRGWRRRS